jgi:hypothetical protein
MHVHSLGYFKEKGIMTGVEARLCNAKSFGIQIGEHSITLEVS